MVTSSLEMDEYVAEQVKTVLLTFLRESAPWAAQQVNDSVRQGRPITKKVKRQRARSGDFVETTVLTVHEQLDSVC